MLENQKLKRQVAQIEDIFKVDIDWQPMFSVSQRPLPVHRRIQMRTASPKSRHELFIGTYNKISFERGPPGKSCFTQSQHVYKFSIFLLCCPLGSDTAAGREQQRGEAPSGDELIKLRFHFFGRVSTSLQFCEDQLAAMEAQAEQDRPKEKKKAGTT